MYTAVQAFENSITAPKKDELSAVGYYIKINLVKYTAHLAQYILKTWRIHRMGM
jgi:hypothetical protein